MHDPQPNMCLTYNVQKHFPQAHQVAIVHIDFVLKLHNIVCSRDLFMPLLVQIWSPRLHLEHFDGQK